MYNGGIKMEKEIIFGSNEFALTSTNIEKMIERVRNFKERKEWTWSLVDTLNISQKGTTGKKFPELLKTLEDRTDENSRLLFNELSTLPEIPADQIVKKLIVKVKKVKAEVVSVDAEHSSNEISKQAAKNARRRAARMAKRSLV